MELAKRIAHDIEDHRELERIPHPVIEAVLRVGIARLASIVPAGFDASEMDLADFEGCECCSTLIDPANPAGARMDSDGIWVCDACHVEGSPPAACDACGGTGVHDCDEGGACENHGAPCGACKERRPMEVGP